MARLRTIASLVCSVSLAVAACSNGDDDTPDTTVPETTTAPTVPERTDDGVLTLGILLPTGNAALGEPMIAAVDEAVSRINMAGGVFGRNVRVHDADEGSNAATAADGMQALLDLGVDAIVGPASSTIALSTLQQAVSDGVVTCSPTASSLALDGFNDSQLFFRTIPSDSLQARAIAETIEQSGFPRASVADIDDAYGRPFSEVVEVALAERGIMLDGSVPFTARDDDLADEADEVLATGAPAIVVIAAAVEGTNMLNALGEADHDSAEIIVVNDAMRTPDPPQVIADLDEEFRTKIVGVAPQADSGDPDQPWDPPGFYAVNAYNCVNLIALAAMRAESDSPRQIAGQMAAVSADGAPCSDFASCVELDVSGREFDYEGPAGVLELLPQQGDPSIGRFVQFSFDETGHDVIDGYVTVGY